MIIFLDSSVLGMITTSVKILMTLENAKDGLRNLQLEELSSFHLYSASTKSIEALL